MERTLRGLWLEVRVIPVLLWSFSALTLGTALGAGRAGQLKYWYYLGAIALGVLIQGLLAHTVNEIEDWRSGTDRDPSPRMLSGGSKVIVNGLLSPRALRAVFAGGTGADRDPGPGDGGGAGPGDAAVRADRRGRRDRLHLAAGAGRLPAVRGRGDRLRLHGRRASSAPRCCRPRGSTPPPWLAAVAVAAYTVSMLMVHHYLDHDADSAAHPRKVTTIVWLGLERGRRYAIGWCLVGLVGALAASALQPRLVPLVVGYGLGLLAHLRCRPDDVESVTKNEMAIILCGIAAALGAAALLVPVLALGGGGGGGADRARDAPGGGSHGEPRGVTLEHEPRSCHRDRDRLAADGEQVTAVMPAEPDAQERVYLVAFERGCGAHLRGARRLRRRDFRPQDGGGCGHRDRRWPSAPRRCRRPPPPRSSSWRSVIWRRRSARSITRRLRQPRPWPAPRQRPPRRPPAPARPALSYLDQIAAIAADLARERWTLRAACRTTGGRGRHRSGQGGAGRGGMAGAGAGGPLGRSCRIRPGHDCRHRCGGRAGGRGGRALPCRSDLRTTIRLVRIVDRAIVSTLPAVPRPVVRRVAGRYMAGETLDRAIEQVRRLNAARRDGHDRRAGRVASAAAEAEATVSEYLAALDAIAAGGLDANVSVKLSALGLEIDRDLALENIRRLVRAATDHGSSVRIDMEHSGLTDATFDDLPDAAGRGARPLRRGDPVVSAPVAARCARHWRR